MTTIGVDPLEGSDRYVAVVALIDGIPFIPALIGLFALSEVFVLIEESRGSRRLHALSNLVIPKLSSVFACTRTMIQGSVIGYVIGVVPGAGSSIASLVSYGMARNMSRTGESSGKGNPEGVVASESANNSS
ncbi:MAG: tripartite tricarboxylate transporter permease, partial [Phycisphaerales bacterium]|nr:tripartite tricarboxylate transporter permease [Phycisphaerales bacterium]